MHTMIITFSFAASLALLAFAEPIPRDSVVLESRSSPPSAFKQSGSPSADTTINLRISLAHSDRDGLEQKLYAVSTPSSAEYGQHLSKEQVEEYVKPSSDTVNLVDEWLKANGVTSKSISPAGDWLQISVPVSKANSLLSTEFNLFTHQGNGQQAIRTLEYSIPSNLMGHINLIHPTIAFPVQLSGPPTIKGKTSKLTRQKRARAQPRDVTSDAVPAACTIGDILPECLLELYGIPSGPATQSTNGLGVSGFIDQFANQEDLFLFLINFRTDIPSDTTFALQTLDGGSNPQDIDDAGLEADLDTQYTVGVANGVPTTFISVGDDNEDGIDGFLDIINFLLDEENPPQVLTTSYGFDEFEIPTSIANELCDAYMQLGARGVSILFASGDGGVSGTQDESCTTFEPSFPSGCPFLTSVGATSGIPETAASFSSGGFSNIFSQPSYQTDAVNAYLEFLGSTNEGLFTPSGRAFPDIAAQGVDIEIAFQETGVLVDGTSCSSPIFASVIALLNDELIAAGKSPLGFLNPFLYSTGASALNDITSGDNPGCGTDGFPATTGWDPVTGLGTPNYAALKSAVGL